MKICLILSTKEFESTPEIKVLCLNLKRGILIYGSYESYDVLLRTIKVNKSITILFPTVNFTLRIRINAIWCEICNII